MLKAEDVAACVMLAIQLPARAVAEEIVIRPTVQAGMATSGKESAK